MTAQRRDLAPLTAHRRDSLTYTALDLRVHQTVAHSHQVSAQLVRPSRVVEGKVTIF